MKVLLTTLLLAAASAGYAQTPREKNTAPEFPLFRTDTVITSFQLLPGEPEALTQMQPQSLFGTRIDSTRFGAVYTLRQDNMPCIIPDMRETGSMPVLRPKLKAGPMGLDSYPGLRRYEYRVK